MMLVVTDVTEKFQRKIREENIRASQSEVWWQEKLEKITHLRHERLPYYNMITDLSNSYILIEIKRAEKFREALGQLLFYAKIKQKNGGCAQLKKILVLFHAYWTETMTKDFISVCAACGVEVVFLGSSNVRSDNFDPLTTIIKNHLRSVKESQELLPVEVV